ncbi:tetratricopeptide repeat protein [Candidatus Gracilibacteria bacterium]|nr:tetratricopeptide repeat protein [Candidatus Gracilibacteria bacterium]
MDSLNLPKKTKEQTTKTNPVQSKKEQFSQSVSKIVSNELGGCLELGNKFFIEGNFQLAEEYFRTAINLNPKNHLSYEKLVNTYLHQKKFEDALLISTVEIRHNPGSTIAFTRRGEISMSKGDLEKAESYFKKAVDLDPTNHLPYKYLADIYFDQERFDEAMLISIKEININPYNLEALTRIGEIEMTNGNSEAAIKSFKDIIKKYPNDIKSLLNLNNIFYHLGKFKEAASYIEKILKIDPNIQNLYLKLGETYYLIGNYREAEKNYLKYISLNPNDKNGYNGLGVLYITISEYDEAIKLFTKATEIDPKWDSAYHNLGVTYFKNNELISAEVMFRQAIFINYNNINSHIWLYNLFLLKGKSCLKKSKIVTYEVINK